jgi:ribosomal protein S18 acetylase RimI-like enzyme
VATLRSGRAIPAAVSGIVASRYRFNDGDGFDVSQTSGRKRPVRAVPDAAALAIRPAVARDLDAVVAIDATVTGHEKRAYWRDVHRRYGGSGDPARQFLVAAGPAGVAGFVIGEVRDWEFGSPPCGWVFAIDVHPDYRLLGVATRLLDAICDGFAKAGVDTVRTLLDRDNALVLSFFRSQGMMAAPLIALEMDLESRAREPRR